MENYIRERRTKLGMSQEELAEKAEVGRTIISQLENGSRKVIRSDTMLKLASALNCSVADIFLIN